MTQSKPATPRARRSATGTKSAPRKTAAARKVPDMEFEPDDFEGGTDPQPPADDWLDTPSRSADDGHEPADDPYRPARRPSVDPDDQSRQYHPDDWEDDDAPPIHRRDRRTLDETGHRRARPRHRGAASRSPRNLIAPLILIVGVASMAAAGVMVMMQMRGAPLQLSAIAPEPAIQQPAATTLAAPQGVPTAPLEADPIGEPILPPVRDEAATEVTGSLAEELNAMLDAALADEIRIIPPIPPRTSEEERIIASLGGAVERLTEAARALEAAALRLDARRRDSAPQPQQPDPPDGPDLPLVDEPSAAVLARPNEEGDVLPTAEVPPEDSFAIHGGNLAELDAEDLRRAEIGQQIGKFGRVIDVRPYEDGGRLVIFEGQAVYVD